MSMLFKRAVILAVAVAILGFIVSNAAVLQWLATQDPILDFFLWYVLLSVWLVVVYWALFHKVITLQLNVALLMFWFALGTVFYWAASDASLQNAGLATSRTSVPAFLLASEDQVVSQTFLWMGFSPAVTVILTYVVVPAILVFVAIMIAKRDGANLIHGLFGGHA